MRPAILALTLCAILEACATSLAPTLPAHATTTARPVALADARAVPLRAAPAVPRPVVAGSSVVAAPNEASAIDLGALARIVTRLPHDLHRVEVDLFICAGAVVAIGTINAFLIASLLATRRRATLPLPPVAVTTPPVVEPQVAAEPVARTCSCGAPIGARSKTGRCRHCALASRSKRGMREVTTAPG